MPGNDTALNTTDQPATASAEHPTEPGVYLLLAQLHGVRRLHRSVPTWSAHCPMPGHADNSPSLVIEYKQKFRLEPPTLWVVCSACKASLVAVCGQLPPLKVSDVLSNNESLASETMPLPEPERLPSDDVVRWRHDNLLNDSERLQFLYDVRGLDEATVRRYLLGSDPMAYYFPVYRRRRRLVNVRTYRPESVPKMKGLFGRPTALYPRVPSSQEVWLVEGELDALVSLRHEIPAVTSTGGAGDWKDVWTSRFRDKVVNVCFDCDNTGRRESLRRAGTLMAVAAKVTVVDLGLRPGEDLTDWFVTHKRSAEDLVSLAHTTTPHFRRSL